MRVILQCSDFDVDTPCCDICMDYPARRTAVYPDSLYDAAPDYALGIRSWVCCHHIHRAQGKPRKWWYEQYLRRSGRFTEPEIQRAITATPETFYRIYGEIHDAARRREYGGARASGKTVVQRVKRESGCPNCGCRWDQVVCNNCGYND